MKKIEVHKKFITTAAFLCASFVIISAAALSYEEKNRVSTPSTNVGVTSDSTVDENKGDPSGQMPDGSVKSETAESIGYKAGLSADAEDTVENTENGVSDIEDSAAIRERRIAEELSAMTIREKLNQMFMVAYNDTSAAADDAFGAYILFAWNLENETPDTISEKLAKLQSKSKYGAVVAVDEEGGTVTRVSRFTQYRSEKFKSPRELWADGGLDAVIADTAEKSDLLLSLGFNMNMAPVADISQSTDEFMYYRSVGLDPDQTAQFVRSVIETSRDHGIMSVVKHFPGYGGAADTHTGIAYDGRSAEILRERDFIPFKEAIDDGVSAVLVSHIIMEAIDSEKPASVSAKTVDILRNELNYDGVIMTDDLAMAGITDFCQSGSAALEAILAGCDMMCCSNYTEQYDAVWQAVQNGTITEERLNASAARILRMKYDAGLWK